MHDTMTIQIYTKIQIEMKKYPACFPENFEKNILPKEANKDVFRVMKYGNTRQSFIGTYEEILRGLIPPKKRVSLNNPILYSTSCNIKYSEAKYALDLMMRHHPRAYIAKGHTEKECGPCQLTSEREERNDTHVDWWIYEDAEPQKYFNEVTKIELKEYDGEVKENE